MLTALHAAAAGMEAQLERLDAVANDVANVSTTGYKSVRVGFRDLLYAPAGRGGSEVATGAGAAATTIGRDGSQGAMLSTARPLDVALVGPGYIRVRDGAGRIALTRDGSLGLTADGRLRTSGGELLEPPVRVPRGVDPRQLHIAADGTVSAAGRRLGQITVVGVTNPDGLIPAGGNLFSPSPASGAPFALGGTRIEQGALEASNVDLAEAMVEMTTAQRGLSLASRAVQMQDEALAVANGVKR